MNIKYLDLQAQYHPIKDEIADAIKTVLDSSAYTLGPSVAEFEKSFASYCESSYAAGVNNGTNALLLALRALEINPGDEVITAANTFIATISAIIQAGAKPVLVDVDPQSRNIDPQLLKMAISNKTRAIIPVHLYGLPADMDPILKTAKEHNIPVLEDAAQAHGARYNGSRVGSLGDIAAFSFYPGKNLGAYGEAGGVVSNNEQLIQSVKKLRDHGSDKKYYHDLIGYNARMSGIQGGVLGVKLKYLDSWNEKRRQVAGWYDEMLSSVTKPTRYENCEPVYHLYVIETPQRDALMRHLKDEYNIVTLIHYPIPNHLQKALSHLGYKQGEFPVTEQLANEILSLPIYPEMTREQVAFVCEKINDFF